eukprot:Opistho-2@64344
MLSVLRTRPVSAARGAVSTCTRTATRSCRVAATRPFTAAAARAPPSLASSSASTRATPVANGLRWYSTGGLPKHYQLVMPALSPTMTQGNLVKWTKKEGDAVAVGDSLAEIETDKAVMDFESVEDGFLAKIFVQDGTKDVVVGKPVCIIVPNKEDVAKFSSYSPSNAAAPPKPAPAPPAPAPAQAQAQ